MTRTTGTVTVRPMTGIRIALRLLWNSIVADIRGTTVTFYFMDES